MITYTLTHYQVRDSRIGQFYTHTHIHTYINTYIHTYTYVHTYIHTYEQQMMLKC